MVFSYCTWSKEPAFVNSGCLAPHTVPGCWLWQAGYRAALQPIQYLTLNLPECWKVGQNFPPGCILLLHQPKPTLDGWCSPGSSISPPQSHTGCFVLMSHLSQPPYPPPDKWLQTHAFLICPTKFYLLPSLPPSRVFCRKLCISGLLNIRCGGMLNCLPWRRSLPRGTAARASYHVLVSQRVSNDN